MARSTTPTGPGPRSARSRHRPSAYDLAASVAVARVVAEAGGDTTPGRVAAAAALQAAFRPAPLYRAVAATLSGRPAPGADELAGLLVDRFGETPAKAAGVAARFLSYSSLSERLRPGIIA